MRGMLDPVGLLLDIALNDCGTPGPAGPGHRSQEARSSEGRAAVREALLKKRRPVGPRFD